MSITLQDGRIMISVFIILLALPIMILPFFFTGGTYQVVIFILGLLVFSLQMVSFFL